MGYQKANTPAIPFLPHKFSPVVQLVYAPKVLFTRKAYYDMFQLVDIASEEVGWIGTVRVTGDGDYVIEEIFLPEQEAHSTTCEFSAEALAKWASETLRDRTDGVAVVDAFRFWGHSHHTMGTGPSQQDENQLFTMAQDCGDFFIRAILNKLGKIEVTLYLFEEGILIRDVAWDIYEEHSSKRRARWMAEIAAKVTKKTYEYHGKGKHYKLGDASESLVREGGRYVALSGDAEEEEEEILPKSRGKGNHGHNNGWDGVRSKQRLLGKTDSEAQVQATLVDVKSDVPEGEPAGPENKWRGGTPPPGYKGGAVA